MATVREREGGRERKEGGREEGRDEGEGEREPFSIATVREREGGRERRRKEGSYKELQGKSEQQQTYWSLQGCSVLNLMYKYNTIYQSSPMIKRKIIQEQIILVVDLQPSIHRDVF